MTYLIKNKFYFEGKLQGQNEYFEEDPKIIQQVDLDNCTLISEDSANGIVIRKWNLKEC